MVLSRGDVSDELDFCLSDDVGDESEAPNGDSQCFEKATIERQESGISTDVEQRSQL
jgi:hypothetical protein